jgi:anti-anti-sigma factor
MLTISNTVNGDVNEVKLVGRLDVKAAREAEGAFAEAAAAAQNVVLDVSELDYIASAGLRALKRLRGDVRSNGGTLTLKGVQDDVMEVLEMTGFAAMLNFE